jgi:nucleotide-binding universal stress UspA family protein
MYRSLLVPLDGSLFGEQALPVAADIARRSGATLRLVHVHTPYTRDPIYVEGLPVIDDQLRSLGKQHERAYLERLRERVARETGITTLVALLEVRDTPELSGTVAEALADYAAATDTGLAVMTTHGRGGAARFWLGSVADALVRLSPVPVLLLRPDVDAGEAPSPRSFQRILIALDGSELAEEILRPALAFGRLMQAGYTLLRVVEPRVAAGTGPFTTPTDLDPDETQRRHAEAQSYLEGIVRRLRTESVHVDTRAIIAPHAALAILEEARRGGADLIALATHGRSGLARLFIGSVADKVLRGADTPVLLYRP